MSASLKDKSVIVPGASKGIAKVFASLGSRVLLVARGAADGEAAGAEIVAAGGTATFFQTDVISVADLEKMAAKAVELYGGIDVLCANAGVFPAMKQSEAGRVVITSSITGPITGFPGWSHYGATKAAQLRGVALGLEFDFEKGAMRGMRELYPRGVWAIFSQLDPRVLELARRARIAALPLGLPRHARRAPSLGPLGRGPRHDARPRSALS